MLKKADCLHFIAVDCAKVENEERKRENRKDEFVKNAKEFTFIEEITEEDPLLQDQ